MNKQKEYGGLTFDELIDISKQINRNAKAFLKSKHQNNEHKITVQSLRDKGKCPYCHFKDRPINKDKDNVMYAGENMANTNLWHCENNDMYIFQSDYTGECFLISSNQANDNGTQSIPIKYFPICGREL